MDLKVCTVCESRWLDGQLYWSTGKEGSTNDLAGLLCNEQQGACINPCKGSTSGQTWEIRRQFDLNNLSDFWEK